MTRAPQAPTGSHAGNPVAALIARYKAELGSITELVEPSMHLFTQLCALQHTRGITGDVLEIGVFRGGTASLLAAFLGQEERIFLIDPYQNEAANRQTIERFAKVKSSQLAFHLLDSIAVNKWRERVLTPQMLLVRFAHIDGEHSYDAVYSDLDLAHRYLTGGGLIVLDDIFSLHPSHSLVDNRTSCHIKSTLCHCEERSDEAIQRSLDRHARLRRARDDKSSVMHPG